MSVFGRFFLFVTGFLGVQRIFILYFQSDSLGIVNLYRQLSVGLMNDLFVALLMLLIYVSSIKFSKKSNIPKYLSTLTPVISCFIMVIIFQFSLGNFIYISFTGQNIGWNELTYFEDALILWGSFLQGAVFQYQGLTFSVLIASTTFYLGMYKFHFNTASFHNFRFTKYHWVALVIALVSFRSASLSNRLILHEPLETQVVPYLAWRGKLDSQRNLEKPVAGFEDLARINSGIKAEKSLVLPDGTNIVVILLESFGELFVEETPEMAEFLNSREGNSGWLKFPKHLANTYRTVGAQFSVLCSKYDPMAFYVIRDYPRVKIPCLNQILESAGYQTSAVSATTEGFDNVEEWYQVNAFQKIVSRSHYSDSAESSSYGVHDGYLFEKLIFELDKGKSPFFSYVLTSTTHHPYGIPKKFLKAHPKIENWPKIDQAFYYTDFQLGKFFREAKSHSWFENTLFVVLGDHPHWGFSGRKPHGDLYEYYRDNFATVAYMYHPMLEGLSIRNTTSHVDIAPTVLALLGLPQIPMQAGKNIFEVNTETQGVSERGIGMQDNPRNSNFQVIEDGVVLRSDAHLQDCYSVKPTETAQKRCTGDEKATLRRFKGTFYDTTQWSVMNDYFQRPL